MPERYRAVARVATPNGPSCSGVLVAPRVVLTAAHCVTGTSGEPYRPGLLHVAIQKSADDLPDIRKVVHVRRAPDYRPDMDPNRLRMHHDWARLTVSRRFDKSIEPIAVQPRAEAARLTVGADVSVVAYGRARTLAPEAPQRCRLLNVAEPLLDHDCVLQPGASGSPLLIRDGDRPRVVGINIGRQGSGGQARGLAVMVPASALEPAD